MINKLFFPGKSCSIEKHRGYRDGYRNLIDGSDLTIGFLVNQRTR
jgi:hypothetical protein